MYIIFVVTETIVLLYYIPLSVWRALFHRAAAPRFYEAAKAWNRRLKGGEIRGGILREITERERHPRRWPLCQHGDNGVSLSSPSSPELISRLNRGPIVIGYSARQRHVSPQKRKEGELATYRFQFPRIIEDFLFPRWRVRSYIFAIVAEWSIGGSGIKVSRN